MHKALISVILLCDHMISRVRDLINHFGLTTVSEIKQNRKSLTIKDLRFLS